jgi:hypothetical protein
MLAEHPSNIVQIIRRMTMLPDGKGNPEKTNLKADHAVPQIYDPYIVSLVTATKDRDRQAVQPTENISVVVDELMGTALRRRTQLLNSGS